MGIVYFPQFDQVLGVRESDGALVLQGGAIMTPTEIGYLDGLTIGTVTASKALVVDANKDLATLRHLTTSGNLLTSGNVGTVTTAATTTAVEHGDGIEHLTVLTMTNFAVGTSGDNAALAIGAKFYTWPTGVNILVESTTISGGITAAISVTTDTPEVGIGTVIASGANATLTTGTWENLVDGGASGSSVDAAAVAPDVAGTVFHKKNLTTVTPIIKATGGAARDLFLNAAVTWSDVTAAGAVTFTGTITIKWRVLS
jgi:hypothetical protein